MSKYFYLPPPSLPLVFAPFISPPPSSSLQERGTAIPLFVSGGSPSSIQYISRAYIIKIEGEVVNVYNLFLLNF